MAERALTEAAKAATRTKGSYLAAHTTPARPPRPHKAGAVEHSILRGLAHAQHGELYNDLGDDYFVRRTPNATKRLVAQLERSDTKSR